MKPKAATDNQQRAPRPLFLFAHGAGASSQHPWMQAWKSRLEKLGNVSVFDYEYMAEGRKRPDPLPRLIESHRAALHRARAGHTGPVILIGKSMGGRVGCHLALEEEVAGLICFGYPLCGGGDCSKLRDKVLLALRTPILFVQGTRDALCPIDLLEKVRASMTAPNALHVVGAGDHSLLVTKTELKKAAETQEDVDDRILREIEAFIATLPIRR